MSRLLLLFAIKYKLIHFQSKDKDEQLTVTVKNSSEAEPSRKRNGIFLITSCRLSELNLAKMDQFS